MYVCITCKHVEMYVYMKMHTLLGYSVKHPQMLCNAPAKYPYSVLGDRKNEGLASWVQGPVTGDTARPQN